MFYDFKPHQYGIEPGRFASDDQSETNFAFVAPLFFGLAAEDVTSFLCYVPSFTQCRDVKLSLGELQKVAKVKSELRFRAVVTDAKKDGTRPGRKGTAGGGMF